MLPIGEVARNMGLDEEAVIPYGRFKAKISLGAIPQNGSRGKLVLMTGMTPTAAGEGKTTTTVGLTQAMGRLGHRATATLREPSLAPRGWRSPAGAGQLGRSPGRPDPAH